MGGSLIAIGVIGFSSADWLAKKIIEWYQPKLEEDLSKKLGHPLLIGQYNGLRPWGISLGPTKLLAGYKDKSTANVSNLKVQVAPISSLLNRRPVLIFTLSKARVNLTRNNKGSYWVLGTSKGSKSPNLELQFRLNDSSEIFFEPSKILVKPNSRIKLNLAESKVKGDLRLDLPKYGSLQVKGNGNWNKLEFEAKAGLRKFQLEALDGVLPTNLSLKTKGTVNGALYLGVKDGTFSCEGALGIYGFHLEGGALKDSLTSNNAALTCQDNLVRLPLTTFKYGIWTADITGNIPFDDSKNLRLGLSSLVKIEDNSQARLELKASLPFFFKEAGLTAGVLVADFTLDDYPLNSLGAFTGQSLSGNLSSNGKVEGPLSELTTNLSFSLENPQFSSIRLQEKWSGNFIGFSGKGGELEMKSVGAALPASISANLDANWGLDFLTIRRLGGDISVTRDQQSYVWSARDFRLDRIELALPPEKRFKRIFGKLSGSGNFAPNPLSLNGNLLLGYPRLTGLKLKEAQIVGNYFDKTYAINGELYPLDQGKISISTKGRVNGSLWSRTELKKISPAWLISTAIQLPKVNIQTPSSDGRAKDLGGFAINPKRESLDNQLREWIRSIIALSKDQQLKEIKEIINPNDIKGFVNGVIDVQGENLQKLNIDLKASGKLWPKSQKIKKETDIKPFGVTIKGPLQIGWGEFTFENIPFSLLSLFVPSPTGLTGMFGLNGRYRLGNRKPELTADLVFNEVGLGKNKLLLKKGKIDISESILKLDIKLQNSLSTKPLTLIGDVPLVESLPINLRIESHGDGINFVDDLFENEIEWKAGSADIRLLITGTIDKPKANGFLVLKNGEILLNEKLLNDINGTMLFDFNRVEIQQLSAKAGDIGVINGSGNISLFKEEEESNPLSIKINGVNLKSSFSDVLVSSKLVVRGALIKPVIGGEITVEKGSISTQRSGSTKKNKSKSKKISNGYGMSKTIQLPEQSWDRQSPLVLFIGNDNAPASKMVKSAIPKGFSSVSFDNLRLNLGPRLRIVSQPVASFEVEGFLLLNGGLDQTINASGLVRLLTGRVNLFTTTFVLDRREPNVAIFVPDMGLIPYVDVKLTTRIPETVIDPGEVSSSSDFATNGSSSIGIGGSRFVKVEVIATGPADRLKDNYQIRSKPPLPQSELLGLIGGNSLANLFKGNDSSVFADVLSRSLVSPVLGNISGAFNERLQINLYPAYVNTVAPESEVVDNQSANSSDENTDGLLSQQAWVTEVGIDLTDRISFLIQATPNRDDIPPQGTVVFQLNQNLGLQGSYDQNGNWQSLVEIFVRY